MDPAAKPPPPAEPTPSKIVLMKQTGNAAKRANHLFTVDTDGTDLLQITSGVGEHYNPTWSPDGQWLCFSFGPVLGSTVREIYRMHPDGSAREQLTSIGGRNHEPEWSPDGSRIAISALDGQLAVLDLNSRVVTFLVPRRWSGYVQDYCPKWSPDGNWIIFGAVTGPNATYSSLYRVPSDPSGAPYQPEEVVSGARWVDWSHVTDGAGNGRLAYTRDWVLCTASVTPDGLLVAGTEQQIPVGMRASHPDWSPDGSALAFNSPDAPAVRIVELATGQVREVAVANWDSPDWSPPIFGGS